MERDRQPGPGGTRRAGKCCRKIAITTSQTCPCLYDVIARISGLYLLVDRTLDIAVICIGLNLGKAKLWLTLQIVWLIWGAKLVVLWVMLLTTSVDSRVEVSSREQQELAKDRLNQFLTGSGTLTVVLSIIPYSEVCILPHFSEDFKECQLMVVYFFYFPMFWILSPFVLVMQNIMILIGRLLHRPNADLEFTLQEWLEIWICFPQVTFQLIAYSQIHNDLSDVEQTVFWVSILFSLIGVVNAFRVWIYHYDDFFAVQAVQDCLFRPDLLKKKSTSKMARENTPIDLLRSYSNLVLNRLCSKDGVDFFSVKRQGSSLESTESMATSENFDSSPP